MDGQSNPEHLSSSWVEARLSSYMWGEGCLSGGFSGEIGLHLCSTQTKTEQAFQQPARHQRAIVATTYGMEIIGPRPRLSVKMLLSVWILSTEYRGRPTPSQNHPYKSASSGSLIIVLSNETAGACSL
ncbi:hypothetical protein AVEN_266366-1 [Araneus ventricosus]|uniref:Uncharacterized protein n=1 Tax=Araneus ventricosus TaxID=182803 RepID=A0A4Y2CT08_ARAVE|nr:hypothetical protein AVEN_266366-1 [Araneus ventricosus]